MDAVALLAELRGRGARVELLPEDHFAVEPASVIDASMRDSLCAHKAAILVALRRATDDDFGFSTARVSQVRDELAAVCIHSELVGGDIWLARDDTVAAELASEVAQAGSEIPILTFAEVVLLRGKSDAMKRALLTTIGAMPGSRLVQ